MKRAHASSIAIVAAVNTAQPKATFERNERLGSTGAAPAFGAAAAGAGGGLTPVGGVTVSSPSDSVSWLCASGLHARAGVARPVAERDERRVLHLVAPVLGRAEPDDRKRLLVAEREE